MRAREQYNYLMRNYLVRTAHPVSGEEAIMSVTADSPDAARRKVNQMGLLAGDVVVSDWSADNIAFISSGKLDSDSRSAVQSNKQTFEADDARLNSVERSTQSAKSSSNGIGCTAILVILILFALIRAMFDNGNSGSTQSAQYLHSGDQARLSNGNASSFVLVFKSVAAHDRFRSSHSINDERGMMQQMMDAEVTLIEPGTRCTILDAPMLSDLYEVRLLDGPDSGRRYFVKSNCLQK
jgi:hypothetical protein